jgi:hypothetical protein
MRLFVAHVKVAAIAICCGLLVVFLAFTGLLWGLPYNAGPFHHGIATVSAVILYPAQLFGAGDASLIGDAFVWAVVVFAVLTWQRRRKAAPTT